MLLLLLLMMMMLIFVGVPTFIDTSKTAKMMNGDITSAAR